MNRLSLCLLALTAVLAAQSATPTTEQVEFFESKIRPVLAQQCFACHTTAQTANLRLDSRADILKGGNSGPAIVPGDPDKSVLIARITAASDDQRMPRGGTRLTDLQIADFKKWVKDGAPLPMRRRSTPGRAITSRPHKENSGPCSRSRTSNRQR
jgi:mono/diheme cytochrome c family protein